jgi:cytochrome c oxidase subunit 1
VHFWTLFFGFHLTFLVQHWLGNAGMPRRYADYSTLDGFTTLNTISTIGAFVLGASTLPFLYNVWVSFRSGVWRPATTRGASATRSSGRRRARRRGTTS